MQDAFYRFFGNNIRFPGYFNPVFGFVAFLERYLKLGNKISSAVCIFCFSNIGPDARAASLKLVRQRRMSLDTVCSFQHLNCKFG